MESEGSMKQAVTPAEARAALDTVERERRRVVDEISVPSWYWCGLALGWVGLGVLADVGTAWLTSVATFTFGAVHASVAPRVISGRRGSRNLSVRASVAPPRLARIVIGGLLGLGALTVGLSLLGQADGADHPTTIASLIVAVIILLGGPLLLSQARKRAARTSSIQ
jgi:hypothetical protein